MLNVYLPVILVSLLSGLVWAQQQLLAGSCNFEQGTCGYTSDPAYARWATNEEGRFITADGSVLSGQGKAVLVSPVLDQLDWSCLRLVYQITGAGSLQLHQRPEGDNFDYALWSARKPSDSWLIASIDLKNSSTAYQILMEARPAEEPGNSVAIFEIHIVPGYCLECNFEEHHLCGYSNHWNPNVNWYVGGSLARDPQSSLPDDHTMNNQRGHYMYVDSVYAKRFQEVAKLTSPMSTTPMAGCLSFYYQRDQERGNIFSVFTRDQLGHYEELWRPEVYATSSWRQVTVDIKAPHPLEVVYEVAFNSARGGYVAIDDISFSPEFCHTDTEPTFDPSVADCDFEEGLCRYYQERVEGKVWTTVTVKPNAYRIGDHTTGTGSFLLANTRFTSRPGYVGRLHGPFLPGNHKYCLRFYYALHGFLKVENALVLYLYDENNVALEKAWTLADSTRDMWTQVDITYMKPMPTKAVFVSICKNFWDCGLVAIDDITVTIGDCRITEGRKGEQPGQCDFETGDCGYSQDRQGDKGDWLRIRGQSPTSYTGPRGDHTTGVGYFMYIEASLMRPGHTARLLSSWLRGSHAPQCLVFHYHMYGSGTGILSVLLRRSGREKDALLWRRRGEQSVSWMRATVDYDCDSKHQIIFEAIRGPSIRSDIAIDDIVFKKGPCKDPVDSIPYSGFSENFNEIDY
ncbi:MAM domain-containing protein 2a isoform X1 [Hypomesus transpacificus]|uniref:MAM domain-containing protein 2a isoform X1 n=1 Tax=Hypomesus transpacificus TaxID=137520 RepID=UPI001F083D2D|nr:MAM domain-containing protein 2a isoform X1 [Hypomesus transpacificus]